ARLDLELARTDAAQIQQIVDHLELGFGALLNPRRDRSHFGVLTTLDGKNAVPTQNGIQWRAQLVGNDGKEFVLGTICRLGELAQPAFLFQQRSSLALSASRRAPRCTDVT